jgi:hypothetical protein
MSESDQRARVVRALRSLDAQACENRVRPGTPDVHYIDGWIELKWLKSWPKNVETPVKIEHFTPQQRVWLKTRWNKGGRAFLLLQAAGSNWLLFDGATASQLVGRINKEALHWCALIHMNPLDEKELQRWLTMDLKHLQERRRSLSNACDVARHNVAQPSE